MPGGAVTIGRLSAPANTVTRPSAMPASRSSAPLAFNGQAAREAVVTEKGMWRAARSSRARQRLARPHCREGRSGAAHRFAPGLDTRRRSRRSSPRRAAARRCRPTRCSKRLGLDPVAVGSGAGGPSHNSAASRSGASKDNHAETPPVQLVKSPPIRLTAFALRARARHLQSAGGIARDEPRRPAHAAQAPGRLRAAR